MNVSEFKRTLSKSAPPAGLSPALAALWWAGNDKWDKAHGIVMEEDGKDCAWVHAYLHRVEGDLGNARYWYRQAGRAVATDPLNAEWDAIAKTLLAAERR
jgi:hypothetical protein